ncbi:hypothetical protein AGLY_013363 [Aphis glycines]|uniref:Transmembrane protein n=1 Tax=Aphis glycines TaxID=307491 RepID=A0A6G0T890_APHGL|nr:hypothetical protein AGLY_013363 [Aphis glycines]
MTENLPLSSLAVLNSRRIYYIDDDLKNESNMLLTRQSSLGKFVQLKCIKIQIISKREKENLMNREDGIYNNNGVGEVGFEPTPSDEDQNAQLSLYNILEKSQYNSQKISELIKKDVKCKELRSKLNVLNITSEGLNNILPIRILYEKREFKPWTRVVVGEKGGLCFNGLNTSKFKITYEELCIKFSTQKKSKYFENQITIYDLYYLNNNKYQKSFEAKPLFNAVFFCLNPVEFFLQIFEKKFMKNLVPNFQNLVIKEKIFTIFQPQNYLQIFAILTYFIFWSAKKFLSLFKKKILRKIENFNCLLIVQKKSKFLKI